MAYDSNSSVNIPTYDCLLAVKGPVNKASRRDRVVVVSSKVHDT